MDDIINTNTACSEEISIENIQTADNNSKFVGYNCKFRKPKRKEKRADWSQIDSVKCEKADEKNKKMVDENRNDKVDSVVCREETEEDHYSNTNEINISNSEKNLKGKIGDANNEEKNNKDFKEMVENKGGDPQIIINHNIIPMENEHCNTDQNIDYNNSLVINNDTKNEEKSSNIIKEENDIQVTNINNNNQNTLENQVSSSTMNDDLELDENSCFAQPVPTLKELADSDFIHNRQLAARKIFESLQEARSNEKELHSVIAIMCKLSEDEEVMVRLELMQQIPSIALHFRDDLFVKVVIRQQLIPYTVKLLSDLQVIPQIRKASQSALLVLLENNLIDQPQLTEWICPLVVQMAMWETNTSEVMVEGASLMIKMIPVVGKEITLKFFLDPFISLTNRLGVEVKMICALGFGNLCCTVGEETTESSLLPVFLKLCNDRRYGVKKACAEVFVDVAKSVSLKTRKTRLTEVFLSLLSDENEFVKCSAYRSLGGFIHTFASSDSTDTENMNNESSSAANLNIDPVKSENVGDFFQQQKNSQQDFTLLEQFSSLNKEIKIQEKLHGSYEKVAMVDPQKSLAVAAKDGHVYVHVNNENLFNNFQFWRLPIPEVELDIDIEPGKATNIHIRAKVQGMEEETPVSEIKVRVAPDQSNSDSSRITKSSFLKMKKVLKEKREKQISINSKREEQSLLDDDSEIIQSSFSESILAFKEPIFYDSEPYMTEGLIPSNPVTVSSRIRGPMELTSHGELKKKKTKMSAFDQDVVPPALLNSFITPVHQYRSSDSAKQNDDEMMECIAYSFPAVAFTLGPKYWPCIKGTCEVLARDMKWTVRRTMASSLHELANILGYEIIMADLFPIFLDLLIDVDEVRLQLVQHLSDFLKNLTPHDRKQFLPLIDDFTVVDSEKNWRYRFALAEQLKRTAELYDAEEISEYFLPIAYKLLHDRISSVRLAAIELIAYLLKRLYQDSRTESSFKSMFNFLDSFYRVSPKWMLRQTYVRLCEELAKQESVSMENYVELIIPKLFSLAWDSVPNIRLGVMRCIVKTLLPMGLLPLLESNNSSRELFHKVLDWMKYDTDNDVRHFAVLYNDVYQNFILP